MNIKKLVVEFGTVFAVALVTTAIVTFLWNIIGRGIKLLCAQVWREPSILIPG